MRRIATFVLTVLVGVPATYCQGPADTSEKARGVALERPAPPAFSMAFVDMERLVKEHPDTASTKERFQREYNDKSEQLKQQQSAMTSMRANLDLYAPDSPEYFEQMKRIKNLEVRLELDWKIIRLEWELDMVEAMKGIYQRCRQVVANVAEERGISVVAMYSSSDVNGRTYNELVGDIISRPFIYHAGALDITDEVLSRLK